MTRTTTTPYVRHIASTAEKRKRILLNLRIVSHMQTQKNLKSNLTQLTNVANVHNTFTQRGMLMNMQRLGMLQFSNAKELNPTCVLKLPTAEMRVAHRGVPTAHEVHVGVRQNDQLNNSSGDHTTIFDEHRQ